MMNPFLKASLVCFIIAIIALLLFLLSCEKHYDMFGNADDKTTYAMVVMGEKYPIRASVGKLDNKQYSQAQAFHENQWKYLCIDYPAVYFCEADTGFVATNFYNPMIWMGFMKMEFVGPS